MKIVKLSFIILAVAVLSFGLSTTSYAFHSGGVAECEGCHTMHNTITSGLAGSTVSPIKNGVGVGAIYLLKGNDQSSTCLNCHNAADTAPSSYHISTDDSKLGTGIAPVEATPGGDFAWLKKSYTFSIRGAAMTDAGAGHGHNINAADYGYTATGDNVTAPGGTYPQANLHCSSCHNPHGSTRRLANGTKVETGLPIFASGSYGSSVSPIDGTSAVGVYRLLGNTGYQPKSLSGSFAFVNGSPDAVAPSTYNRLETTTQTHVAYGQGMSEWCANCHGAMLENAYASGVSGHRHPAGKLAKLTAAVVANYNSYVTSGIMTNSDPLKAYSSLVPFELGTADYTVLKPLAVTTDTKDQSASTSANVMCLTCHRAHASGFPDMTRFFLENEFMTIADSGNAAIYDSSTTEGKINYGKTQAEQQAAYYGRPATAFGPNARDLCNKCHAKD